MGWGAVERYPQPAAAKEATREAVTNQAGRRVKTGCMNSHPLKEYGAQSLSVLFKDEDDCGGECVSSAVLDPDARADFFRDPGAGAARYWK